MKSEQYFRVTYDGPALQAHEMDVRVIQTVANGELRNQYSVLKVIEHREPLQKALI